MSHDTTRDDIRGDVLGAGETPEGQASGQKHLRRHSSPSLCSILQVGFEPGQTVTMNAQRVLKSL